MRRMVSGRVCQLAQLSGVSPFMSLALMIAPACSSRWITFSLPKAAARCNGVSPLVRQSRMNAGTEQHVDDEFIGRAVRLAQRRVQGCLSGVRQAEIHVRAMLNQVLAELPVAMKRGAIETKIW